ADEQHARDVGGSAASARAEPVAGMAGREPLDPQSGKQPHFLQRGRRLAREVAVKTLRELALFAFFLIAATVLTWPLAANLPTAVSDLGDPLLNAWILDWDCYALTHQPPHLFGAPIFYPAKYPLAYSEHLVGVALLILPFWLTG